MATSLRNDAKLATSRLQVGAWQVDSARNEIRRGVEAVRLEPKVIEVLVHLAARPGEVISREELLSAVWPGVIVGDDALTQAIIKLRKALGDDAHKPTYIETISKRGYRLIASVEAVKEEGAAEAPSATESRRLAAILSADIAGYSRLMQDDAPATVKALKSHQTAVLPLVAQFGGRVIDLAGDGILAEFPSAVGAVQCAIEMQRVMATSNASVTRTKRLQFRIGVHIGDVIHDARRIYGDGVNIAARIQGLAPAGGVLVSQAAFEQVRNTLADRFVGLGSARLKNIREPAFVYQLLPQARGTLSSCWLARSRFAVHARPRAVAAAGVVAVIVIGIAIAIPLAGKSIRMPWPLGTDTRGSATSSSIPVVAVLPLANLSGDSKREYFSDGITEDVITGLGRFSGLRVMSLNAVQEFKGRQATLQSLQDQLGARYIVKGSVREADGQLRVAIELSDAHKGELLWAERYDGTGSQIFEIQDRIVRKVVSALQVKLTQLEQERAFRKPSENLEAHDLVLRARWLLGQLDRRSNRTARELLTKARELSPEDGEILTALGESEVHRALYGWVEDPADAMHRAEELARRALALPDTRAHAHAHVLLSTIYSNVGRDKESLQEADQALAANPSDASALWRRAGSLLFTGRIEEAIVAHEAARRLEPGIGRAAVNFAYAYYLAGRYADALALAETKLISFPNDVALNAIRTASLAQLQRNDEARRSADAVLRLSPGFEVRNFALRFTDAAHSAKLQEGLIKAGLQ